MVSIYKKIHINNTLTLIYFKIIPLNIIFHCNYSCVIFIHFSKTTIHFLFIFIKIRKERINNYNIELKLVINIYTVVA